jgi:hypothetical protein
VVLKSWSEAKATGSVCASQRDIVTDRLDGDMDLDLDGHERAFIVGGKIAWTQAEDAKPKKMGKEQDAFALKIRV